MCHHVSHPEIVNTLGCTEHQAEEGGAAQGMDAMDPVQEARVPGFAA